ncbi:MAG: hypothetical protein HFE59_04235 [Clostridiales bacterium]|nr:hypothetical protein [Clostridiales bacterium]
MPIFFILFLGTVLGIQIMMRKNKVDFKKTLENIQERERKANLSKKREIDKEFYIIPDEAVLPVKNYDETSENKKIIDIQKLVLKKASLTMIKFDEQISNTDLKFKYGFSNLETITIYEEHYNSYMQTLVEWAKMLFERNNLSDAEIILNEAIRLKCDLSKAYMLLIDIYRQKNDSDKLKNLINTVENSTLKLKTKILKYSKTV